MSRVSYFLAITSLTLIIGPSTLPGYAAPKEYPNKPITMVIQFSAGGGTDVATRGLAKEMQTLLGQPVIVESRPGASGIVAGDYVAKAKPDGYTIGALTTTATDPELYSAFRKSPYTSKDLKPVDRYIVFSYALVSKQNAPWKNLQELIQYAKNNPNKVKWGHLGIGHHYHMCGVAFSEMNKLTMIPVPFKGGADVVTALLGGHIDIGFASTVAVKDLVESRKLVMLAVEHPQRVPYMPEYPTFKELGQDLGVTQHYLGLFVPKDTPEDVVKKIDDTVKKAVETPSLKDFAFKMCFDLYYGSASDLMGDMQKDREVIGAILKKYKE